MFENNSTKYLPPPGTEQLPVPAEVLRAPWYGYETGSESSGASLSSYLWILRRHLWKILSFVFVSVAATLIVSSRLTPIYESTATVDIDRQMPTGIIGQEANQTGLNDADQFLATQVKLIQSDSVLRPVAEKYNLLTLEAGNPNTELSGPVVLKKLNVARPPNTYLVLISYRSPDARLAADVANSIAHSYLEHTYDIRFRSSASLSQFMEKQLEELKVKMERSSSALAQFEKELNVINPEEKTSILSARLLQLNTEYTTAQTDRVRKEATSNSVREGSLEAAQASAQGEALHKLAERLDEARQKFAEVKTHYGTNHPEYNKAAAQVTEIESQLRQGRESAAGRVEVEYREAVNREAMLRKAVGETKAEFDRLNARSFEYQSLKREAEAGKKLYEELVRKIKEAEINSGFQNSAIRIADEARPGVKPVFPKLTLNLVLAFLLSSLVAVGIAILSDALDNTVRDPEQIAALFNTEVIGSLPMVKRWRNTLAAAIPAETVAAVAVRVEERPIEPRPEPPLQPPTLRQFRGARKLHVRWHRSIAPASQNARSGQSRSLGQSYARSVDGFEEAVRTLRNSILLHNYSRRIRTLMVTSAWPSEGKTTTAVHLALAHAEQKHRTLLIDGDLRRPGVHSKLRFSADDGLATVLANGMLWREKLVKIDAAPNLDVLPAGIAGRRSADLIGRGLPLILEQAAREYDLIIVDAPPTLGFPEPLQMAAAVDGVIVVAKAGQTNRKAVGSVLNTLRHVRANVLGLVLNSVSSQTSDSYGVYGYNGAYQKYYKATAASGR